MTSEYQIRARMRYRPAGCGQRGSQLQPLHGPSLQDPKGAVRAHGPPGQAPPTLLPHTTRPHQHPPGGAHGIPCLPAHARPPPARRPQHPAVRLPCAGEVPAERRVPPGHRRVPGHPAPGAGPPEGAGPAELSAGEPGEGSPGYPLPRPRCSGRRPCPAEALHRPRTHAGTGPQKHTFRMDRDALGTR